MKHSIKHSDRLVGNRHLYEERLAIYQTIAQWLIGDNSRPLILIDWSDYSHDRSQQLLRASVPVGSRALTLYEEVYPLKAYGQARIHKRFLNTLYGMLDKRCCPIIVTDAGFIGPWFREVKRLGWDYVGRIRENLLYRETSGKAWIKCKTLYKKATATPTYSGDIELIHSAPFPRYLYLYRQPKKGRHKLTHYGVKARSKHSKKNAKREQSPWILVSSLGPDAVDAKQLIQFYRSRMQIEEGFRDIKDSRTGFSLTETRSRSPERLANLLLVGMLATLVVWLMGRIAEEKQWHHQYQANTVRSHRVLSLFYLGCLLVVQGELQFTQRELKQAIKLVQLDMIMQGKP